MEAFDAKRGRQANGYCSEHQNSRSENFLTFDYFSWISFRGGKNFLIVTRILFQNIQIALNLINYVQPSEKYYIERGIGWCSFFVLIFSVPRSTLLLSLFPSPSLSVVVSCAQFCVLLKNCSKCYRIERWTRNHWKHFYGYNKITAYCCIWKQGACFVMSVSFFLTQPNENTYTHTHTKLKCWANRNWGDKEEKTAIGTLGISSIISR